jgi:BirA family transcriptional regulator, biotin operon repressor / biotin---[acetyl-CoA-carboxylase] ligase
MPGTEPLFRTTTETEAFSVALARATGGWTVEHRAQTPSTNDLALQAARAGDGHGRTFVADEQTAGRGQRGRSWHSPPGLSLLFSSIVRGPGLTPDRTGWVALCAGLACAEALREEAGVDVRLKWPNDLVVLSEPDAHPPWRKVGGILVESRVTERVQVDYAVVGIGVNANQQSGEFPPDARTPPVSLRLLTGCGCSRLALLERLLRRLAVRVAWVQGRGDFSATSLDAIAAFERWWQGWDLQVRVPSGARHGRFAALDTHGRLQLTDRHGRRETYSDAEWLDGGT